jgi:hypothetical protein
MVTMPSRFEPIPVDEIDLENPYDIYVSEASPQRIVVYRKAFFRGLKDLLRRQQHDFAADFVEIGQANGQSVFVRRSSIVKFCKPGTELIEQIPPKP